MGFTLTPRAAKPSRLGRLFRISVRILESIGFLIALAAFVFEFGYHKYEERTSTMMHCDCFNERSNKVIGIHSF